MIRTLQLAGFWSLMTIWFLGSVLMAAGILEIPPATLARVLIGLVWIVQQFEGLRLTLPLMLAALFLAHAIADGPMQPHFIGSYKNRFMRGSGRKILRSPNMLLWPLVLGLHASIHAAFVGLITGSAALGLAEFAAHFAIDYGKSLELYEFKTDQALHIGCKVLWVAALAWSA